jgi:hypothetical protein
VVEQWTENPRVVSSTLTLPIKFSLLRIYHGYLQRRLGVFVAKLCVQVLLSFRDDKKAIILGLCPKGRQKGKNKETINRQ